MNNALSNPVQTSRQPPSWLGLIPVAIAFIAMAAWSWRKWGDVLVDFGFQLYMPWQICEGKVLYRDGGWPFGPLSQYYDALLFKIFGVSITTLIWANLALVTALVTLVYWAFQKVSDQITAAAAGLIIVLVFAFSQYVGIGNYNYICPYACDAVHGLLASIATVVFLWLWIAKKKAIFSGLAGFFFGLVFLTKPELFLAISLTTVAALVPAIAQLRRRHSERSEAKRNAVEEPRETSCDLAGRSVGCFLAKSAALFIALALTPVLFFFVYFAAIMSLRESLRITFVSWSFLFTTKAANNSFYQWCLGLEDPAENAALMIEHFRTVLLILLACFLSCRWKHGQSLFRRGIAVVIPVALVVAAWRFDWGECGRSLPLLAAVIGLHLFVAWKGAESAEARATVAFPLLWTTLAFFLLAKMGFHSRVWHYGFVLAMPAAVAAVYYFGWFLPQSLRRFGVSAPLFRATIYALIAIGVVRLIGMSDEFYRAKTYPVGKGGDTMLTFEPGANPRGKAINLAVDWFDKNTPPTATIAAIPEGVILNYLTRRPNPTKYHSLVMMAGLGFEESEVVGEFSAAPPDYIALVHRDAGEFGVRFYGQVHNYGAEMMHWIESNYTPVYLIGHEPMRDRQFGIKIFRRNAASH